LGPDKVTDNVTKMFLGVQLQCAQCHNHPFTSWKQTEYWGMAAFFLRVQPQNIRPLKMVKSGEGPSVQERKYGIVKRLVPASAKIVPAKFLGGSEATVRGNEPLRPLLAAWLTARDNPYFSRAMVNRTWAQLFGRGLVNPVDDMHDANPASHPQLLADLAAQFTANDFDVKYLFRALCNSAAYQRTSKAAAGSADVAAELYSRMLVKVLTPQQMFDSLKQVFGDFGGQSRLSTRANGKVVKLAKENRATKETQEGKDAKKMVMNQIRAEMFNPRALFISFFKTDGDFDPTEYQSGIPQALRMMNAPQLNQALANSSLVRTTMPAPQAVQRIYLAALSRRPTPHEQERAIAHIQRQRDARRGLSDLLWALLNSSEFSLNH
ncbi:MAG: DUF1553 domain-containing protein, partial [Candidatus Acidiferrum sp.]